MLPVLCSKQVIKQKKILCKVCHKATQSRQKEDLFWMKMKTRELPQFGLSVEALNSARLMSLIVVRQCGLLMVSYMKANNYLH